LPFCTAVKDIEMADEKPKDHGPYQVIDGETGQIRWPESPPEGLVKEEKERDARIQRENAAHEAGFPVAGHDPHQRDRER